MTTEHTYADTCPCTDCRATRTRRAKKRSSIRRMLGVQDSFVSAQEPLRQVNALRRAGLSMTFIAERAGYAPGWLRKIAGPKRWSGYSYPADLKISAQRAAKIDDLYQEVMTDRRHHRAAAGGNVGTEYANHVSVDLTRRALQGLQAQGFSTRWIADQLGVSHPRVYQLLHKSKFVTPEFQEKIVNLTKKIGSAEAQGPRVSRVKSEAAKRGYQVTAYCDDLI